MPSACVASTAKIGISSIIDGTSFASISMAFKLLVFAIIFPIGSPASFDLISCISIKPFIFFTAFKNPILCSFMPTFFIFTFPFFESRAEAIKNEAEEISAGIVILKLFNFAFPVISILSPILFNFAPDKSNSFSKWSLVGIGSIYEDVPSAFNEARRKQDFTWALAFICL